MGNDSMEVDVGVTLRLLRQKTPADLQPHFAAFEDLHGRKYLMVLFTYAHFLIPLYEGFIAPWETKMNALSFVQLALITGKQHTDPAAAITFMDKTAAKVAQDPHTKDAYVLATMESAHFKLLQRNLEGTKHAMEECAPVLDQLQGVEALVHASFYRVSAEYNKVKAEYNEFYKNALLFLACVAVDELPVAERVERAFDLSVAALMGDAIYNFGELLMHPILNALKGTPHEWLGQLLFAFNAGDIGKYDVLATNFNKLPLLTQGAGFLRQKLCLMALIELVFKRVGDTRRIPFAIIGQETRLPADEIEHLLMKALSLKLIRGSVDQVDQVIIVDWVQPRVLDKSQLAAMKERLGEWAGKVSTLTGFMASERPELFVQ